MSQRFMNRASGTSNMTAFSNDAEVRVDSADEKLKFYDKTNSAVRSAVTEDQTQTLTNKTLTAPTLTSPVISGATVPALIPVTTITGDGAITIASGIVVLTKGSPAAITLAASTAIGTRITIVAGSAFAHVVTATGLLDDGITGGSKNTATFAAFVGAAITLIVAQTGKWAVESKNVVTVAA